MFGARVRWTVAGLLFASTVINYLDRQTLSVLAPILKQEYHWTNSDFASTLIAFRIAYTIMQGVGGRLLDVVGTRVGMALVVAFYSLVAIATSTAHGLGSFRVFRFLLGLGEGPNMPGAAKVVAEWFPGRERAWAVAMFDSGSSIGGALAPFIVLYAHQTLGSWRLSFLLTGSFGLLWLLAWLRHYHLPADHPRISAAELAHIREGSEPAPPGPSPGWRELMRYRQTWGIVAGRFLLDPYWFFIAEWFALYLSSRGFDLAQSALGFWLPFLGADLGNFIGGGISSALVARGWPVGKARKAVLMFFGPSMIVLLAAVQTTSYWVALGVFAYASLAYAACSTMFLSLPADVFHSHAVGTVAGMAGTGAGLGTLLSTYLIGRVTDATSFAPVIAACAIVPCVATLTFLVLVRRPRHREDGSLLRDF